MVWHLWRYFLYSKYLEFCMERLPPNSIQRVAISDSRDVFVLGNIWHSRAVQDAVLNDQVMFSLQGNPTSSGPGAPMPIRHRRTNMRWIRVCFPGAERDAKLLNVPVSCSGVTVGSSKAMLNYTNKLADLLLNGAHARCWVTRGADQALHIMLLKMSLDASPDLNFRIKVLPNGESPVYSAVHGFPISVSPQGKVAVARGFLREWRFSPMILHQYDRDEHISRVVRGVYNCSSGVRYALLSRHWLGWAALQGLSSIYPPYRSVRCERGHLHPSHLKAPNRAWSQEPSRFRTGGDSVLKERNGKGCNSCTCLRGQKIKEKNNYAGSGNTQTAIRGNKVPTAEAPCIPFTKRSEKRSQWGSRGLLAVA
eukprot:1143075-Pelagomonas_calceolata.AAC.1